MPVRSLLLALAVGALLAAKYRWLPLINVNWDEFHYLARVHEHLRGELPTAFQTFHVHLFGWLAAAGSEVEQVIAARRAMFILTVGTYAGVWLISRRIAGVTAAWFAVLVGLAVMYGLRHGESFRADPMLALLFIAGAALLVLRPMHLGAVAGAAAAWALAAVISIKALIYLPAFALLLAANTGSGRTGGKHAVTFVAVASAVFFGLHAWHAATVMEPSMIVPTQGATAVARGMWLQPRWSVLVETLTRDWGFWLLAMAGGAIAVARAVRGAPQMRHSALVALALALPVLSVALYRNGFEYFYPALVPGVTVLCGIAFARVETALEAMPRVAPVVLAALAIPSAAVATQFFAANRADATVAQRDVIDAVHRIFPEPVPYLDRCGMIATFPKVGPLLSTYVLEDYRARGTPVMAERVARRQPVFVLANVRGLELGRSWHDISWSDHRLLPADHEFLRANYVHHWGPIWVAGKSLYLVPDAQAFVLPVAGRYTVESAGEAEIDGTPLRDGDVVTLAAGEHTAAGRGKLVLRFGVNLYRPDGPPADMPIFMGL